ncbi:Spt20 family-domain-containing protein [Suillus tomentosus]|nr:Spt20 family-domain-containing protein [Suillus tomentosus]
MSCYNITRSAEQLLDLHEDAAPSFSVHLYPDHWTLNNGSKFLYNNPIASILDDVRAHRIPVDYLELFDSARVPFYDGCMLVELLDYRPKKAKDPPLEKPERSRVALHPNDETLWANLCLMNQRSGNKFTDTEVLELEAQILLQTAPPLCLDPDPHLTRIANHTLRVSTPSIPISLKRKAATITPEEDESDKTRRAKIMQFMNQRQNRSHAPRYFVLFQSVPFLLTFT